VVERDAQPQRRRALFGVHREYADALEQRLARAEEENAALAASLRSARAALGESAGWSERLPGALRELARLAAGEQGGEDTESRLASAVLALAGEHLVASVNVTSGEPTGEIERETRRNENGRPIRTIVKLGACVVDCTWQPEVEAGPDTTGIVEGLCTAVVCSLAGVAGARAQRDVVTQLGDRRALARHLALRQRLGEPAALVLITVDGESAIRHRELYGRLAWSASLAQSASVLERIARVHGGQAYQTAERELRLLVDAEEAEAACRLAEEALAEDEDLVFRVGIAQQR
jgi:GGDEF domain-containing protein